VRSLEGGTGALGRGAVNGELVDGLEGVGSLCDALVCSISEWEGKWVFTSPGPKICLLSRPHSAVRY
jgi:hypothetical protein